MSPVALFFLLTTVSAAHSDMSELEDQIAGLADGTRYFQKNTKLPAIVAREMARLSERITRDCEDNSVYRPSDGVCNNLENPEWGTQLQTFRRLIDPAYNDGEGSPRMYGKSGIQLPSSRRVSVACFESDSKKTENFPFSQMVMQWGQFIDHDISGTPKTKAQACCAGMDENGKHPDYDKNGPCFPIQIPRGDRQFKKCMEFSRSLPAHQETENCPREQVNVLTAYLDAGVVYGNSVEETETLRTGRHGTMKTSDDDLLPGTDKLSCIIKNNRPCFDAGDHRVNVFPGLAALHTIWVREHNRLAKKLALINKHWRGNDEKLFQEARKIVIALMNHITYDRYLRDTLGEKVYNFFGLGDDFKYDETVNPGIFNSFATAAFRYGHSQIAGLYDIRGKMKDIKTLFFDPSFVYDDLDGVITGLTKEANQLADAKVTRGVSDHLFENTSTIGSFDLMSLNIQRGRDHGLPPYLEFVYHWSKIFDNTALLSGKPSIPLRALGLYESLYEVDLFVGGMDEAPVKGGMVGPTFAYIIGKQFKNLRNGDRFWYETKNSTIGFTKKQLASIRKVTLARVICDNTCITKIQPDVFRMPNRKLGNKPVSCSRIPSLNLKLWKENKNT